jgi:CRISPR-associated protein Cas2
MMLVVVTYDIPNDKRRTQLAKALEDFGDRVQFSVFECLLEPPDIEGLAHTITNIINPNEDAVRIYRLCASCERTIRLIGQGNRTTLPDAWIL